MLQCPTDTLLLCRFLGDYGSFTTSNTRPLLYYASKRASAQLTLCYCVGFHVITEVLPLQTHVHYLRVGIDNGSVLA